MRIDVVITGESGTVTLTPCWLARLFGARIRRGDVKRCTEARAAKGLSTNQRKLWYWVHTERVVDDEIHRAIETQPVESLPRAEVRKP